MDASVTVDDISGIAVNVSEVGLSVLEGILSPGCVRIISNGVVSLLVEMEVSSGVAAVVGWSGLAPAVLANR